MPPVISDTKSVGLVYSVCASRSAVKVAGSPAYSQRRSSLQFLLPLVLLSVISGAHAATEVEANNVSRPLTLNQALTVALANDPWLSGSQFEQQVIEAKAVAAYQLPDPKFSLALANLPTDTFDFGQEAMTQLVFGVSQIYPRGDSRRLKREQLYLQSERQPLLRREREAKLTMTVTQLWLSAYQARESVRLINQNIALFDQLVDISMASYSSALGRTRQQDLIQAQLEQAQVQDRLTRLQQQQEVAEHKLLEWLLPSNQSTQTGFFSFGYSDRLPQLNSLYKAQLQGKKPTKAELAEYFVRHPLLLALDQNIAAAGSSVSLAKQKYKPQWGVSASYGYRGEDMSGRDRPDLFSAGVTLSLPLFSSTAQDKEVEASVAAQEKIRTERSLMLRQMISAFQSSTAQIERLDQRLALYSDKLLPLVERHSQAALKAYESDNGDFIEVVRSRINALNTRIEHLKIRVEQQKQVAQLNYMLTTVIPDRENTALINTGVTQ